MSQLIASPKADSVKSAQFYGDEFGMSVFVSFSPNQRWIVKKKDKYWWLRHKGVVLRLTDTALHRLFNIKEGDKDE